MRSQSTEQKAAKKTAAVIASAACVYVDGSLCSSAYTVGFDPVAVRPAVWIHFND